MYINNVKYISKDLKRVFEFERSFSSDIEKEISKNIDNFILKECGCTTLIIFLVVLIARLEYKYIHLSMVIILLCIIFYYLYIFIRNKNEKIIKIIENKYNCSSRPTSEIEQKCKIKTNYELYNKLLEEVTQWGSKMGEPPSKTLLDCIKIFSSNDVKETINYLENISSDIRGRVYNSIECKKYQEKEILNYIRNNYPWINEKNIRRIISQGAYTAWRDFG